VVGLRHSFFARDDVVTRRYAVGHDRDQDGTVVGVDLAGRLYRRVPAASQ
jgi:hypothetical protein